MSKNGFKKFKKNDYSYEDEEYEDKPRSHYLDRKKERRIERALRTKDISILAEEEYEDLETLDHWSQEDYKNSMRGQ
jgi:hypothetical protein